VLPLFRCIRALVRSMEWSTRKMRSWWDTGGHTRNHGVDHVSGIHFWYINVATYWQFIEYGLMPVYLVYLFIDGKHRSCCAILFCFLSTCYFWLDAASAWWFDASSLAERSICWQWRFLFFLIGLTFSKILCRWLHTNLHEHWCTVPFLCAKWHFTRADS